MPSARRARSVTSPIPGILRTGRGAMNSVFARFVAGGGDDAALIGTSADDNRLAAQIGAVEKLDGDEEGVHVHVENIRDRWRGEIIRICVQRPKSRQVRHEVSLRRE